MSIKERLKIFIEYSNLSVSAFEKSISASNGYVNSISKSIGADKLDLIAAAYPQLNLSWVRFEEGEMLKSDSAQEEKTDEKQTLLVGKRLTEYTKHKGISIKEFASKCDIGYNNATSILKGSLPLGMHVLHKIKKAFPNLNTEWALFENGEMEINNTSLSVQNNKEVEQLEQINYLLSNTIKDKDKTISSLESQIALMQELKEATTKDESPIKSNVGG